MNIHQLSKTVPLLFITLAIVFSSSGCQTGNKPQTESQKIDTLIDNVRAENKEMQEEQTDGDLYEPMDYNTDPTYSGASE
ncbi:hypothetical protein [Rubellicoccus peritrichatus]|uniref:Uncharacterized protein n=1 Tax=Rubellicoccus peritrichatus TaxID=3080537 RepID=A0AAQ3QT87_9BACT|nr:hypothetical protein [Puniceicoccus sp. CR14]WOO41056.1 hypothetical protein RZN69_20750 [Puniceicoccus sp. CR14]